MDEMNTTIDTLDIAAEAAAPAETMDQYADELNATMRTINVGDILDGTVVGITDTEVTVDLQYAAEGIIRNQDYSSEPGFSVKENVKPGDEIKAVVKKLDDGNGNILLSRKEAADAIAWDNLKKMMEEKATTLVTVKEAVKGGVVTYIDGIRAFIPASRLSLSYVEDLATFVGKEIPVRVIEAAKEGRKLVLSSREALQEKREAKKAAKQAAKEEKEANKNNE